MTNPTASQRYHSLDSLRAVMMLLGVFIHIICAYSTFPDVWWYKDQVTHPGADVLLLFIHVFRLPVFFVMAGFFGALLYTKRGWPAVAANRAKRILVPFLAFLVILYPLLMAGWFYGRNWHKPGPFAATLGFIAENGYWKWIHPMHLWFLEYLLIAYVLGLLAIPLTRRMAGGRGATWFRAAVTSRWRAAIFAIPTFGTLTLMSAGLLDTPHSFIPVPKIVLAYAVFFFFGWVLYLHRDLVPDLRHGAWTETLLAILLGGLNFVFMMRQFTPKPHYDAIGFYGTAATGALIVWLIIFGVTGLFVRYFDSPSARMRYLADSAYWQYLLHAPVVLAVQLTLAAAPMHWLVKTAIVALVSVPVLLLSYEFMVRRTWVGVLLNGRRYEKSHAAPAPANAHFPTLGPPPEPEAS